MPWCVPAQGYSETGSHHQHKRSTPFHKYTHDHPNICTIHEIDEAEGQAFLAMAFLDGSTVSEKIKERPLKLDEALDIALQAGEGLRAAHEKGIVHRDVKSSNLMLTKDGRVQIMDFGLAYLADRTYRQLR